MAKQNDDFQKSISLTIQSAEMTAEVLRSLFHDYLKNTEAHKSGKVAIAKLAESGVKLEEVKISDKNIGSFREVAQKYNISYALMKNPATVPPLWEVRFKSDVKSKDTFERAFRDFAQNAQKKPAPILQAENIKRVENVRQQQEQAGKEKSRNPNRENHDEPDTPPM